MKRNPSLEDVLAAVGAMYEAALDQTKWSEAVPRIAALFDSNACALIGADQQAAGAAIVTQFGYDPALRGPTKATTARATSSSRTRWRGRA